MNYHTAQSRDENLMKPLKLGFLFTKQVGFVRMISTVFMKETVHSQKFWMHCSNLSYTTHSTNATILFPIQITTGITKLSYNLHKNFLKPIQKVFQ